MAVVNLHTFPPGSRKAFRIGGKQGRRALLINNRGKLHCLDAQCFHFGGPLWEAPIEEVGDRSCLRCPWHQYRIDIETGECFDNFGSGKGIQQRRHHVHVDPTTGDVFVKENLPVFGQPPLGSDKYCDKGNATMPRAGAASAARRARLARQRAAQRGQQSILNFTQQKKHTSIQYNDATPEKPANPIPNTFQSPPKPDILSQPLTQPTTPMSSSLSSSSMQENLFSQQNAFASQRFGAARRASDDFDLTQKESFGAFGAVGGASPLAPTTPQNSQLHQQSLTNAFRSTRRQTQKIENSQKLFSPLALTQKSNTLFASPSPSKGLYTQRSDEYALTQPDDLTQKQLHFDGNDEDAGSGGMLDDEDATMIDDDEDEYQLTQPDQNGQQQSKKTLRQSSIASFFAQR